MEIDHDVFSMGILIQERLLSVTFYNRKYVHRVMVNSLV